MNRYAGLVLFLALSAGTAFARTPVGDLLDGVDPGPDGMIDVLTVFAHQDDESPMAGTLMKMREDERVRIHILCLSQGDASEAKFFLRISGEHLARIRKEELETAAAVIGAEEVIQKSYRDHYLNEADPEELTREILGIIESTGAEMVFTHDPLGMTRNPDHIACNKAATEAFKRSDAQVLYYTTLPLSQYWIPATFTQFFNSGKRAKPTVRVDVGKYSKLRKMAFYAHATQNHFSFVGLNHKLRPDGKYEYFAKAGEKNKY